ncbi:cold shock domain-containing protein [Arenimonas daejeonensis]|uniref:cold shock domain-containing protein n=1 Tax=Arenimonas daejeonensis TaxID=370777 RepID=UPI0011BF55A2|nr:cold shock domain-containing protein [Arenimonas daejeonensis]
MRTHGHLSKWNDDRGFGFITLGLGGEEVFVHISAFPRRGGRPSVGELVSFEVQVAADGKKRAINIQRAGQPSRRRAPNRPGEAAGGLRSLMRGLAIIAITVAAGSYVWWRFNPPVADAGSSFPDPATDAAPATVTPAFQCDGRTHCSQMTSCAEARYFLKHCPGTQMDGNNDGEPCEQQCAADDFGR